MKILIMKKVLFFVLAIAFTTAASAQTISVSSVKKAEGKEMMKESSKMDKQITEALMKDEGLQKETIGYLGSNKETKDAIAKLTKANKGSNKGIMKAILGDKSLSTAAIEFISSNPELLNKAMKLVGM